MKKSILLFGMGLLFVLTLSGCGAMMAKKTETPAVKDGRAVTIEMRFDASDMIERASEAGCDVEAVKVEASKRKDTITLTCREPEGMGKAASKTIVIAP